MHIILIMSFLFGGLIIYLISSKEHFNMRVSIWGGFVLFLYGALRSKSVGTDVPSYTETYLSLPFMTFKDIFSSTTIVSRDPFFYAMLKLLTYLNKDPQFMIVIISAIVAIGVSVFIYKNSVNPIVSFVMFITLPYFAFTLSGLRQAIAWAIVMLSYNYIKEKKLLKFMLILFVACLFHKSAILFIFAYPFSKIKRIDYLSVLALFVIIFNFLTDSLIIRLIVKLPLLSQFDEYVSSNETTSSGTSLLLVYILILLFAFIYRKYFGKNNYTANLMYILTLIGIVITSSTFEYANLFRIGYYFIFPIIVLLPYTLKSVLDPKLLFLVNYIVILLLFVQFIIIGPGAGTDNYQFYWE